MTLFMSSNLTQEPLIKINDWIEEAIKLKVPLAHAMSLSTVDASGQPSSRMVLLKAISNKGLIFFTDYESQKGQLLEENPKGALNFWWPKTDKQIRVEGICNKTSKKDSDNYFLTRSRGSQISASVSLQSQEISNYKSIVNAAKTFEQETSGKNITRPERWGGYNLKPQKIEFWINEANRLHRRELFTLKSDEWHKTLLSP